MQATNRLEHFPISFFSTVMGLAGLTIAWEKIHIGGGLLVVLTGIVALLLVRTFGAVRKHGICVPGH